MYLPANRARQQLQLLRQVGFRIGVTHIKTHSRTYKVATDAAAAPVSTADIRATPVSHPPHPISQESGVAAVEETALQKQKLVEEFQYLLEKSQSLFSGLR